MLIRRRRMEVKDEREENVPRTDKQRDAILKGKEQKEERKLEGREREEGKRERGLGLVKEGKGRERE